MGGDLEVADEAVRAGLQVLQHAGAVDQVVKHDARAVAVEALVLGVGNVAAELGRPLVVEAAGFIRPAGAVRGVENEVLFIGDPDQRPVGPGPRSAAPVDAALVGGDDPQRLGVEQRAGAVAEIDQHAFHGSGFLFAVEGSGEGVAPGRADLHFFKPLGGGGRQGGGGEDDGC